MADGTKRTGGDPVFDTDRAWERFEKRVAREPAPAFWRQAEGDPCPNETRIEARLKSEQQLNGKDGAVEMKRSEAFHEKSTALAVEAAGTVRLSRTNGAWLTEKPGRRTLRRLTAGVAAAVVAVSLFASPLGDQALAAMMQTFRIQHVVGVGMTADDMASISNLLERGSPDGERSFDLAQYGTLTQSGGGEARVIPWEEAERRMGAPLFRLENNAVPLYQPAATLTFQLNVQAVNRLLTRLGSATTLPAEADGKLIRLHVPDGVSAEGTLSGKPVRLLQYGKPELTMDHGIDAAKVREAILGLPVLPDSLRTKLASIGDWRSTLPVPVRDGTAANLRLSGHDAVMTVDGGRRYLFWLDGDRMGLLSGAIEHFPEESDFLRAAEELIQP